MWDSEQLRNVVPAPIHPAPTTRAIPRVHHVFAPSMLQRRTLRLREVGYLPKVT